MLAGRVSALHTGAASGSSALEHPAAVVAPVRSVSRRAPVPRPHLQRQRLLDGPSTACRIASVDRAPQGLASYDQALQAAVAAPAHQHQQHQRHAQEPLATPTVIKESVAGTKLPALALSWAGSGIYFWWQLGAVQYLMEHYDLTKVPMVGASGGALCAIIAACGVDPIRLRDSAYELSLQHKIWDRPLGLLGVWGSIIEQWLHDTLPDDAHERCNGRVGIIVTELPSCRQVVHDQFESKADLVNCAMASAHVPVLLDWKLTRSCRGVQCVDGSFPDFFYGNCDHLVNTGLVFDYFEDPAIVRNGRMDMLQLKHYEEIQNIMRKGYHYAAKLHREGRFAEFDCSGVVKQSS